MRERIAPELLVLTNVASVVDEIRAHRLQMHVNLGSVRCLSAVYRLLIGTRGPFLNLRPLLYYPDTFSTPITTPLFGQKTRDYPK